jgi:hypothetical protein
MQNHRAHTRVAVSVSAKIVVDGEAQSTSCLVRNLSEAGACLQMASTTGLPADFTLVFDTSSRTCHVMWRTDTQLGVTFGSDLARQGSQAAVS